LRYVLYGAGAIGGTIGSRLHQRGHDVVLIARGAHYEEIRKNGLRFQSSDADDVLDIPVVSGPGEASIEPGDRVVCAMKAQDTASALRELSRVAGPEVPVFCAQNGVENERIALRLFQNVYGMYVLVFGAFLRPGVVQCFTAPSFGVLDLGRFPADVDEVAQSVASDLEEAGFDSLARPDIMRWKYGKLLSNVFNAIQAIGAESESQVFAEAVNEAVACYEAAGIDYVPPAENVQRWAHLSLHQVDGADFPGSSSWQSVARGTDDIESDYLNGEIVLLGRLQGIPTPVNELLQRLVREVVLRRVAPGEAAKDLLREGVGAVPDGV